MKVLIEKFYHTERNHINPCPDIGMEFIGKLDKAEALDKNGGFIIGHTPLNGFKVFGAILIISSIILFTSIWYSEESTPILNKDSLFIFVCTGQLLYTLKPLNKTVFRDWDFNGFRANIYFSSLNWVLASKMYYHNSLQTKHQEISL